MFYRKAIFATVAMSASMALAAPASAATIIVAAQGGPFSLANPIGTLPATKLNKNNTYDFTFTMVAPIAHSVTSLQAQAQVTKPVQAELIQYQLYAGTPGSGTFIGQSSLDFSPVLAFSALPGSYYAEVTPSEIAKNGEVASGSIATVTAVPEPAAWAMMLIGIGGVGAALRRRPVARLAV